jgi:putative ABC transport system permease protein
MLAGNALTAVLAGLVVGLVLTAAGSRVLRGFLFEVSPSDPGTLASVAVVIAVVAGAAACVPLRRATRIDPCEALRHL